MFPSTLSTFARPAATDRLNSPSHSALHNTVSSAVGQIEATIGVTGANSVVGTMMYDLRSPASNGGGHIQTANKGGTGQTAYTKGDILIASSASVLTKLAVGTDTQVLTANSSVATGVTWATRPIGVSSVRTVNVSSVWSKPSLLVGARVTIIGAGGGGGGGAGPGGTALQGATGSVTSFHIHSVLGGVGGIGGGQASGGIDSYNGLTAGNGGQGGSGTTGTNGGSQGSNGNGGAVRVLFFPNAELTASVLIGIGPGGPGGAGNGAGGTSGGAGGNGQVIIEEQY